MKTNRTLKEIEAKSPVNAPIPGSRIGGASWKIAVVAFAALGLVACGTTSSLKPAVDKNSWALGGGLAAGQTPEGFMHEAAVKVANEVQKARSSRMVAK